MQWKTSTEEWNAGACGNTENSKIINYIICGFIFDITEKAKLDGKQTSGSRELGDQQEGTGTISEGGGAVYALTCGGYWVLCSLKLTELNRSNSRFTKRKTDFTFHNVIGNSFFPMMSTQCSLYGVKQGSLTSLTLVALTLTCSCPWGGLPGSSLF